MEEYLVSASVSSKEDWDACGSGMESDEAALLFGFMDHSCQVESLDDEVEEASSIKASIAISFKSKEAWEEFKAVGDWVFSCYEEEED